ncbi:4Fe-4S dicluster domain-containing protein [Bacillus marinisedimentorum]|uniref:4Fe-4S dicluster domain-containing protein n=1 Tax=Bacillus marinisedimentorum TaxID=1821260 RepID=UPI0007E0D454|nr:4Fe-4S binding protein [Bacillus marinisedimentorum]
MKKTRNAFVGIDDGLCKGCGICVSVCPTETLSISNDANAKGYYPAMQHNADACIACNKCATMCPEIAIEVFVD